LIRCLGGKAPSLNEKNVALRTREKNKEPPGESVFQIGVLSGNTDFFKAKVPEFPKITLKISGVFYEWICF